MKKAEEEVEQEESGEPYRRMSTLTLVDLVKDFILRAVSLF